MISLNSQHKKVSSSLINFGGGRGIRTPDTIARIPDFESGAFNQALPFLHISKIRNKFSKYMLCIQEIVGYCRVENSQKTKNPRIQARIILNGGRGGT